MNNAVGSALRQFRERAGLTQSELAQRLDVAAAQVSQWETGERRLRLARARQIGQLLSLEPEEMYRLFAFLHTVTDDPWETVEKLSRIMLSTQLPESKKHLSLAVEAAIARWRDRETRRLLWAVIPVAGWQAELLTPRTTAELIRAAMQEGRRCGIDRYVIVVAPSQQSELDAALKKEAARLRIAVQRERHGLGHAVLTAREHLPADSPFALLLPDDLVRDDCLKSMMRTHQDHRSCVVSLRPLRRGDQDVSGVAVVRLQRSSMQRIVRVEEKPTGGIKRWNAAIIGRYILTAAFLDVLEGAKRDPRTGRIELTDSLDHLAKRGMVFGHFYRGAMNSLSPLRLARKALEERLRARGPRLRR